MAQKPYKDAKKYLLISIKILFLIKQNYYNQLVYERSVEINVNNGNDHLDQHHSTF